jgi:hypothetical protein
MPKINRPKGIPKVPVPLQPAEGEDPRESLKRLPDHRAGERRQVIGSDPDSTASDPKGG